MRTKLPAVLTMVVIAGLVLFTSNPAQAQPGGPPTSASSTGPKALPKGTDPRQVGISIPAVTLFQCPTTACNQGLAYAGDRLEDLCHLDQGTPWGGVWDVILDLNNNEV